RIARSPPPYCATRAAGPPGAAGRDLVKVLMVAYACEPGQGSEPAVGWEWAHEAVAAGHEVWVITRRNNRGPIEAALGPGSPKFEYVDLPRPFLWAKRRTGHLGLLGYYYFWQLGVALAARRL